MNKEKTKSWKVLEFIGSKGEKGTTLKEIQAYIWVVLNGKNKIDFHETELDWEGNKQRLTRGYWCTNLYGTGTGLPWSKHGCRGLLKMYCKKVGSKWVLENMPSNKESIYKK